MDSQPTSQLPDMLRELSPENLESIERVDPKALNGIIQLAQLGQMVKIRKALERKQFKGVVDEITLTCIGQEGVIDIEDRPNLKGSPPWVTAVFFNDGPNVAYIGINNPNNWFTIRINESHPTDFSESETRISKLYFWCDPGNTASIRAKGKY